MRHSAALTSSGRDPASGRGGKNRTLPRGFGGRIASLGTFAPILAYFLGLSKSRCDMPARRAPDRLAALLTAFRFSIAFTCVRLSRMGATQRLTSDCPQDASNRLPELGVICLPPPGVEPGTAQMLRWHKRGRPAEERPLKEVEARYSCRLGAGRRRQSLSLCALPWY